MADTDTQINQPTPQTSQPRTVALSPEQARKAIHLLDEWLADESGHDEETWPKLKAALQENRLSYRSLLDE